MTPPPPPPPCFLISLPPSLSLSPPLCCSSCRSSPVFQAPPPPPNYNRTSDTFSCFSIFHRPEHTFHLEAGWVRDRGRWRRDVKTRGKQQQGELRVWMSESHTILPFSTAHFWTVKVVLNSYWCYKNGVKSHDGQRRLARDWSGVWLVQTSICYYCTDCKIQMLKIAAFISRIFGFGGWREEGQTHHPSLYTVWSRGGGGGGGVYSRHKASCDLIKRSERRRDKIKIAQHHHPHKYRNEIILMRFTPLTTPPPFRCTPPPPLLTSQSQQPVSFTLSSFPFFHSDHSIQRLLSPLSFHPPLPPSLCLSTDH